MNALVFALPVTVVGLQMILLQADLSQISTSFTVATGTAWLAFVLAKYMQECGKPSTLISCGLLVGLCSAFFLIDYKGSNTTFEKRENLSYTKSKLLIGLTLAVFAHTLGSIGIEAQVKNLIPRRQHLFY